MLIKGGFQSRLLFLQLLSGQTFLLFTYLIYHHLCDKFPLKAQYKTSIFIPLSKKNTNPIFIEVLVRKQNGHNNNVN